MPKCTIHLIARQAGTEQATFIEQLRIEDPQPRPYIVKGKPCGWVHRPHKLQKDELTRHDWDLFLLTEYERLPERVANSITAHISVNVDVPDEQYNRMVERIDEEPQVAEGTPALPKEWSPTEPGIRIDAEPVGNIPDQAIVKTKEGELGPGELRLDERMKNFLTNAEPRNVRGSPACFFNLFKYKNGDRSTHDSYMEGFKENYGPAAGAVVKFMGPVDGPLRVDGEEAQSGKWDDTNLVQYDSVWHYAYMLSTDTYKKLNEEKVSGLEDTCILIVSELGL